MLILLVLLLNFLQVEVPLKPNEEFDCRLTLSFKTRTMAAQPVVNYTETVGEHEKRLSTSPLPYLKIKLKFIHLSPEEFRMQVLANDSVLKNKKIATGEEVELDFGFTDDIKDGIRPRDYVVLLSSKERKSISRITISFTKEGDYLVNGIKRGRI